jgi:hypothetical protein
MKKVQFLRNSIRGFDILASFLTLSSVGAFTHTLDRVIFIIFGGTPTFRVVIFADLTFEFFNLFIFGAGFSI